MSSNNKNRKFWNQGSDSYQSTHGAVLSEQPLAWGAWRIPEAEIEILGQVKGRRVLELGCGAAQWTIGLVAAGAHAVGIDLSEQQLTHARAGAKSIDDSLFVHGDAESLPFRSEVFDIVFCDHGATSFAAPERTVSEASRVLKPGGLFAFCMSTPILNICKDPTNDSVLTQLSTEYFGMSKFEDGESIEYQLSYGDWIRLFRADDLIVEDLVELQPPPDAVTTYSDYVPLGWARRWPAEHIWKLRKATLSARDECW